MGRITIKPIELGMRWRAISILIRDLLRLSLHITFQLFSEREKEDSQSGRKKTQKPFESHLRRPTTMEFSEFSLDDRSWPPVMSRGEASFSPDGLSFNQLDSAKSSFFPLGTSQVMLSVLFERIFN